ncbi:MAG: methylenetetrahydrofolate reductase [Arcanobacterium sp.]|nr:methylenetetrahydrofolate reductase [Arcanobacterium sp.]
MPPRTEKAVEPFFTALNDLLRVRPNFISITYGAGGKDRSNAQGLVTTLVNDSPTHPIAHLTTVGACREEICTVIEGYLDQGVRSFLALRGDPPVEQPDWQPEPNGVRSAAELVSLIRLIEARRKARHPGWVLRDAVQPLTIAVATFVNGNPQTGTSQAQEIDNLLVKQEAGASLAITQLFWEPELYPQFVDRARRAGVRIPIVPGVLPPVSAKRLARVGELTGVQAPEPLLQQLQSAKDETAEGIAAGAELARALVDAGAPGIHIYTFNKSEPALRLLAGAGLLEAPYRKVA